MPIGETIMNDERGEVVFPKLRIYILDTFSLLNISFQAWGTRWSYKRTHYL